MNLFPVLCVDNFYKNPDKIREFALSLEYIKHKKANYPGVRTKLLHEIDEDFFNNFCRKLFSCFYNFNIQKVDWVIETCFQQIKPFHHDDLIKLNQLNSGWIHQDGSPLAGVIYLNPNPKTDCGTSIFEVKNSLEDKELVLRDKFYRGESVDIDEYITEKHKHNNQFFETIISKNVYNRLFMYPGNYFHKESSFLMNDNEPRLTQVFFVHKINVTNNDYPLLRTQREEL